MLRLNRPVQFFFALFLASLLVCPSWADDGPDHQLHYDSPVPLGVSGGNITDQDGVYCCGGTLGGLLQDSNGLLYILSNNHVLARVNRATLGDGVIQPGLIDVGCQMNAQDVVADLYDYVPIDFNNPNEVDAAIASVRSGLVDPSGSILDIGPLATSTLPASLDMLVKKSGRTTGLTHGVVKAIGVTVNVGYPKKCGSRSGPAATFINQIRIESGDFSAGGDSGSLVVEDVAMNPRAVGLLFAGGSTSTIANPIDSVLASFGMSMVGGTAPNPGDPTPTPEPTVAPTPEPTPTTPPGGGSDSAQCITFNTTGGRFGDKHLVVTVSVVDSQGASVSGAVVDIDLYLDGSFLTAGSGATTNSAGDASYTLNSASDGEYQVIVTAINGVPPASSPDNLFRKGVDPVPDSDCSGDSPQPSGQSSSPGRPSTQGVERALDVKSRHESKIMGTPGVLGTGVGISENGEPIIEVYLESDRADSRAATPSDLEGIPVRILVTGPFEAY